MMIVVRRMENRIDHSITWHIEGVCVVVLYLRMYINECMYEIELFKEGIHNAAKKQDASLEIHRCRPLKQEKQIKAQSKAV